MSLQNIAQHLANQGRGKDTTLVHMTPNEVSGLAALAKAKGGQLTINPQTGLPEAGFLEDLLPTVIGGALSVMTGGTITPLMAGLGVGAISGLASGNLGKGLMAGLGAYGGAGLTEGLVGLGAAQIGSKAAESAVSDAAAKGLTEEAYNTAVQQSVADRMANATMSDKIGAGLSSALENPKQAIGAIGAKTLAAAASPIFAGENPNEVQTTTPRQTSDRGYIRPYTYEPITQRYTAGTPYAAAKGGLMSLANGGSVGYATGGVTDAEIKSYIDANIGNPQAIADAAKQYGVTAQDLSRAGGYSLGQVNDYFSNAGINFGNTQQGSGQASITNPSIYNDYGGAAAYSNPLTNGFGATQQTNQQVTQPAQSAAAAYAASQGQNLDNIINAWIGANPNATRATIDQQMQQYGISQADLAKALANPAYSSNVRAGLLQQNKGLADLNTGISSWIAAHPNATDAEVDAAMAQWGVSGMDVGRALSSTGGSKGLEYGLLAGNMGPQGINNLITNWIAANPKATYNQAVAELGKSNLNEADVIRATGKTLAQLFPVPINQAANVPVGASGQTGPGQTGGGTVVNPNGTITTSPNIPGIPAGGFTGMKQVRDVYTEGGGSLGYIPYAPKTMAEFNAKYKNTGDTKAMYDYLMGKGSYPTTTGTADVDASGNKIYREPSKPYSEVMGAPANPNKQFIWNQSTGQYAKNPDYVRQVKTYDPDTKSGGIINYMSINQAKSALAKNPLSGNALADWAILNNVDADTLSEATGMSWSEVNTLLAKATADKALPAKEGGLMALANGGLTKSSFADGGQAKEYVDSTGAKHIWDFANGIYRPETMVKNGITYKWNPTAGKYEVSSGNAGVDVLMNNQTGGQDAPARNPFDAPSDIGIGGRTPLAADYLAGKVSGYFAGPKSQAEIAATPVVDLIGTPTPTAANKAASDYAAQVATNNVQAAQSDAMANAISGADNQGAPEGDNAGLGGGSKAFAYGGMAGYAGGGLGSLGGYSDGGQLLRGPGDGVSDNIPATIGGKQPARLANNEFVIPARIVSELGNGSTEAGAKRLYQMMDRVQNARKKSIGKGKVAVDSKAYRHLPA